MIPTNKKVYIFKDIKNKRWTVYDYDSKKHLGYRSEISLMNCELIVIDAKRKKVRESGKRFPHAWIVGFLTGEKIELSNEVTYNPFKDTSFKCKGKIIKKAKLVSFKKNGQVFK